jgi:hypothetical protein
MAETSKTKQEGKLPKFYNLMRAEKIDDAALLKLADDFKDAPKRYLEIDAEDLAHRFVKANIASMEKWDMSDAISFTLVTETAYVGVLSRAATIMAAFSSEADSALKAKKDPDKASSAEEFGDIMQAVVMGESMSFFVISMMALVHDNVPDSEVVFANAMLGAVARIERDSCEVLAKVFKREGELFAAAYGRENNKDSEEMQEMKTNLDLCLQMAQLNEENVSKLNEKIQEIDTAVMIGEGSEKAMEWADVFSESVRKDMGSYFSAKREESNG